jgi:TetR/AcrR family transcriptional regulator
MSKTFRKLELEKQEFILDSAAKIFAEKGYYQANISEICKKAGISNGALYKYFKNKANLYSKTLQRMLDLFQSYLSEINTDEGSFSDILERLFTTLINYGKEYPHYVVLYYDLGSPSMGQFSSKLSAVVENLGFQFLFSFVEKSKAKGMIRSDIETKHAAGILDMLSDSIMFSNVSEHYQHKINLYYGDGIKLMNNKEKMVSLIRFSNMMLA